MAAPPPASLDELSSSAPTQRAAEISVIIYGARSVWRKNDQVRPLYVVFGVGGDYYRTAASTDVEPIWNETQSFSVVSDLLSLRITLREEQNRADGEDRVIGRVRIPILGLPDEANAKERIVRFTSDNPKFNGCLVYRCYVTRYCPTGPYTPVELTKRYAPVVVDYFRHFEMPKMSTECIVGPCIKRWLNRNSDEETPCTTPVVLPKLMQASMMTQLTFAADCNELFPQIGRVGVEKRKKTLHQLADSPSTLSHGHDINRKKSVMTMHKAIVIPQTTTKDPIHFLSLFTGTLSTEKPASKKSFKKRNLSDPDLEQMGYERNTAINGNKQPILTSVEPPSGPVWGGTRLTITGEHLGEDATDITELYVCGSNCLSTLEYESPQRISCVTKAWRACIGSVVIITASGGRSVGTAKFTFEVPEMDNNRLRIMDSFDTISLNDEPDLAPKVAYDECRPRVTWTDMLRKVDESTQTNGEYLAPVKMPEDVENEMDELRDLVETLQQQLRDLKETNQQQQKYVDALVARVIEECPTALVRPHRR